MIIIRLMLQTVFLALGQIWNHKVRSVLTTLGIIIGVSAVVSIVAAMKGMQNNILAEFEKIGTRRVWIDGDLPRQLRYKMSWLDVQLKIEEIHAIGERCPSIEQITPMYFGGYTIRAGPEKIDGASVIGIWSNWHSIENRQVIVGRPFTSVDEEQATQVCLLNEKAIEELDLPTDPIGQTILIAERAFRVVGVVETVQMSAMFGGGDSSAEFWVPFSTARNLNPNGWINMAWAQVTSTDKAEDAQAEIRGLLRQLRELKPDEPDTFDVEVIQQFIENFNKVAGALTAGLAGIVSIALLVGGIGIMNIMLVSVSERTREIGLRKSIGARPEVVLLQFLVEAVVLCLVGAAIGIAFGQLVVFALGQIPDSPLGKPTVPSWAIALSAGFSAATGIIFGMFPAVKAARLNPIDALRHE